MFCVPAKSHFFSDIRHSLWFVASGRVHATQAQTFWRTLKAKLVERTGYPGGGVYDPSHDMGYFNDLWYEKLVYALRAEGIPAEDVFQRDAWNENSLRYAVWYAYRDTILLNIPFRGVGGFSVTFPNGVIVPPGPASTAQDPPSDGFTGIVPPPMPDSESYTIALPCTRDLVPSYQGAKNLGWVVVGVAAGVAGTVLYMKWQDDWRFKAWTWRGRRHAR